MNYRANRCDLHVGDLVIHDGDAKEHRMVRVVVAFKHGMARTVYAFKQELPEAWRKHVFLDRPKYLHNPKRFHIALGKSVTAPVAA